MLTFFGALAKGSMHQVHGSANLDVLLQHSFMWTGENKCSQTHTYIMSHKTPLDNSYDATNILIYF